MKVGTGVSFSPGVSVGYVLCGVGRGGIGGMGCFGVQGTMVFGVWWRPECIVGSFCVQHWGALWVHRKADFLSCNSNRSTMSCCLPRAMLTSICPAHAAGNNNTGGRPTQWSDALVAGAVSKNTQLSPTGSEQRAKELFPQIDRSSDRKTCGRRLRPFGSLGIFDEV